MTETLDQKVARLIKMLDKHGDVAVRKDFEAAPAEVAQAVARGWLHYKNCDKEMDVDLASAISEEVHKLLETATSAVVPTLWLWKNFVDGRPEYWAFDNAFPVHADGDPQTLGQPCGYALIKPSRPGRPEVSDAMVLTQIAACLGKQESMDAGSLKESEFDRTSDAARLEFLISKNVMVAEFNGRFWLKYQDGAEGVLQYKSAYDAIDAAMAAGGQS